MLDIEIDEGQNLVVIKPEGKLEKADFKRLTTLIDGYVNTHDHIPSLVIEAVNFPKWKKFGAFLAHLKFVRNAQSFVPKVALISDSKPITFMAALARHFVKARVRHFPLERREQAFAWVKTKGDHPGVFRVLDGFPNDVIAIEAEGVITAKDYEDTLKPLVAEKKKRHDKLKMLFVVGDGFQSYGADALWADAKFGLSHWADLSRLALVTDVPWMRAAVKLFGPLMPAKIRVFHKHEYEDAAEWIKH